MASLNKVILIGNLGRDPEIKYIGENNPVAKFSLATTESYKDKNGEWKDTTEWHNIVAWRYLAEKAEKNLKKGMLVYVEGKITNRSYEDKDGIKKYITEIHASNIINLSKREPQTLADPNNHLTTEETEHMPQIDSQAMEPLNPSAEDDLPF